MNTPCLLPATKHHLSIHYSSCCSKCCARPHIVHYTHAIAVYVRRKQETVRPSPPLQRRSRDCSCSLALNVGTSCTTHARCRKSPQTGNQAAAKRPAPARASRPVQRRGARDENSPDEPKTSLKGIFAKDLGDIMYGFGDSTDHPVPETLDAVEAIAVDFVRDLITKCLHNVRLYIPSSD